VANDGVADDRMALLRTVADTLLHADGHLDRSMRAAAFAHAVAATGRPAPAAQPLPDPLAAFVDKVTRNAYKVVDDDIERLRQAGFSDDAILEAVLATAVGAGVARFEIGLDAIAGRR
jgi:alkylhydroperoxidase family enzyme